MKKFTNPFGVILALAVGSVGIIGCHGHDYDDESVRVGVHSGPLYADFYNPGYYYDDAYYDNYGRWYPRTYYYWDGHRWSDRDDVPRGEIAHHRHEREEREEHERREQRDHRDAHRDQRHDEHHD